MAVKDPSPMEQHKGSRAYAHKKPNANTCSDFQLRGPLPTNTLNFLATSVAYQQISLVFLSQTVVSHFFFWHKGKTVTEASEAELEIRLHPQV